MKNYIEEFLKDNNIKLGEKFDINSDMYKDFNPYYISYSNDERYDVYDCDEDDSVRLLIKLLSEEEKVVKLDSYKERCDEERNNEDNKEVNEMTNEEVKIIEHTINIKEVSLEDIVAAYIKNEHRNYNNYDINVTDNYIIIGGLLPDYNSGYYYTLFCKKYDGWFVDFVYELESASYNFGVKDGIKKSIDILEKVSEEDE